MYVSSLEVNHKSSADLAIEFGSNAIALAHFNVVYDFLHIYMYTCDCVCV